MQRYRGLLLRAARRYLRDGRAEDAVQQAFLAAWSALQRGDEVRELRAWLYRIVHNTALNALRASGYDHAELPEGRRRRSTRWSGARTRADALSGLAALPERQREALLRVAVEGRPQGEVARELGVSEGAVRQLVHRARLTLRAAATAVVPLPLAQLGRGARRGAGARRRLTGRRARRAARGRARRGQGRHGRGDRDRPRSPRRRSCTTTRSRATAAARDGDAAARDATPTVATPRGSPSAAAPRGRDARARDPRAGRSAATSGGGDGQPASRATGRPRAGSGDAPRRGPTRAAELARGRGSVRRLLASRRPARRVGARARPERFGLRRRRPSDSGPGSSRGPRRHSPVRVAAPRLQVGGAAQSASGAGRDVAPTPARRRPCSPTTPARADAGPARPGPAPQLRARLGLVGLRSSGSGSSGSGSGSSGHGGGA